MVSVSSRFRTVPKRKSRVAKLSLCGERSFPLCSLDMADVPKDKASVFKKCTICSTLIQLVKQMLQLTLQIL